MTMRAPALDEWRQALWENLDLDPTRLLLSERIVLGLGVVLTALSLVLAL